ncbi:MAG: RNA methyltransferase [Candidatus Woesearchaeota archaeon]|nr:RNA methyltransferase [Candidatus Woesearchaeota archaeon]
MRQIEGRNPVLEALRAGTKISMIYFSERIEKDKRIEEIEDLARKKQIPMESQDLSKLEKSKRCQGVIAIAESSTNKDVKSIIEEVYQRNEKPLVIMLSGTVYEHNLGSVLRSAECAGACVVLAAKDSIGLSPMVVKTSAGASEHIPLLKGDLYQFLKDLRELGLMVVALSEKAEKYIYDSNLNCPLCIIIGAEDAGVKKSLEKYIDEFLKIPIKGRIESLNMGVAAAVAMYECVRQKSLTR